MGSCGVYLFHKNCMSHCWFRNIPIKYILTCCTSCSSQPVIIFSSIFLQYKMLHLILRRIVFYFCYDYHRGKTLLHMFLHCIFATSLSNVKPNFCYNYISPGLSSNSLLDWKRGRGGGGGVGEGGRIKGPGLPGCRPHKWKSSVKFLTLSPRATTTLSSFQTKYTEKDDKNNYLDTMFQLL